LEKQWLIEKVNIIAGWLCICTIRLFLILQTEWD